MISLTTTSVYIVVWLLFQQWFISVVHCAPYEAYPVSKQLPPVARVNEEFAFVISNDTYKSSVDKTAQITYNAYDLPTWLTFDSNSRTFSGTPPSSFVEDVTNNIQYFNFILQGTDTSDNSSLNETYTLVATLTSSISVASNFNLLALLKNYGNTNGKDALILTPNEIFNVTFDRSSFTNDGSITSFYGRSAEYNAPLPSWLFFDSNTLKFSGTAPTVNSAIAPEAFFQFTLIATDINGYMGVQIPFQLVIGAHQLTTSVQNTILINVTDSGSFSYALPLNYVYFDNNVITSTNLKSIVLQDNSPSWVTLNNDTLTGSLDNQTRGGTFSVAIYDDYGDVVYLNFEVLSTKDLFATNSLPNINATRGEYFQYSFLPSQFTSYDNTTVSIIYPNTSQSHDWLNFQSSNLTLYGNVPYSFQSLNIGVKAEYEAQSQELDFQIIGMSKILQNSTHHNYTNTTTTSFSSSSTSSISKSSSTSHSITSSITSTSATNSATSAPVTTQHKTHSSNKKTVAIACGVVIPVVVVGSFIILLLILWRRRRSNGKDVENSSNDVEKSTGPSGGSDTKSPDTITAMHNPFVGDDEESQSGSDFSTIREEKMGHHPSNELSSSENVFSDVFESQSRENLLSNNQNTTSNKKSAFFNPYDRTSSFYMDAEPANTKSWRYNSTGVGGDNRQSTLSLNTVTTADLFNTEIKEDEPMKKDPRKSSLGLRDSVFGTTVPVVTNRNTLSPLTEHIYSKDASDTVTGTHTSKLSSAGSNSSNDDFIPMKNGDDYKWVHSNEPNRRPSKKRFVNLTSEGKINVGQANSIEGQEPEMI